MSYQLPLKIANFIQLSPEISVFNGYHHTNNVNSDEPLFCYCLDAFENFINY